ncbi:MAG: hypothetical protein K2Z81_25245, partial [Cyanobacteria bacterium]|nr:hypothetical protein [Cyanobacteriota bacterium]
MFRDTSSESSNSPLAANDLGLSIASLSSTSADRSSLLSLDQDHKDELGQDNVDNPDLGINEDLDLTLNSLNSPTDLSNQSSFGLDSLVGSDGKTLQLGGGFPQNVELYDFASGITDRTRSTSGGYLEISQSIDSLVARVDSFAALATPTQLNDSPQATVAPGAPEAPPTEAPRPVGAPASDSSQSADGPQATDSPTAHKKPLTREENAAALADQHEDLYSRIRDKGIGSEKLPPGRQPGSPFVVDNEGRIKQFTTPEGLTYSNIRYDVKGELLSLTTPWGDTLTRTTQSDSQGFANWMCTNRYGQYSNYVGAGSYAWRGKAAFDQNGFHSMVDSGQFKGHLYTRSTDGNLVVTRPNPGKPNEFVTSVTAPDLKVIGTRVSSIKNGEVHSGQMAFPN